MAYFRDNRAFGTHRRSQTDDGSKPFYYRLDRDTYLVLTSRAEQVPHLWKDYRRCRYDFVMSFVKYLNENGVDAKITPLPREMDFLAQTETPEN